MELPQKLTSDLKTIQHQMKLQIQTHQIMRIKQVNDPNNCKLNEDLREIEKRISCLGEKQNQLMKWLRKLLTAVPSNNAVITKTIASSLGINVNGTRPNSTINPSNISCTKCITGAKKNKTLSPVNDQIQNNGLKSTPVNTKNTKEESGEVMIIAECKEKNRENEQETKLLVVKTVPENCAPTKKIGKNQLAPITGEICKKKSENAPCLSEPLTAEKERFLSAVGLVTRDILKELQNKRVERKRRSTANHTQFVYGSNWDISSKKRKKSNYLTSSAKQLVTRQAAKTPNPRLETPTPSLKHPTVSIFKTPLPVSNHSQNETTDINTTIPVKSSVKKELALLSADDGEIDRICPPDLMTSAAYDCKQGEMCFVCQKPDLNSLKCSCSLHYHHSCAEVVENCVGCGEKLKCNISGKRLKIFSIEHNQSRFEFSKMVIGQS